MSTASFAVWKSPAALALLAAAALTGCASRPASPVHGVSPSRAIAEYAGDITDDPRTFPAFAGSTGAPLHWSQILARMSKARVIVVGELHDDANAHAAQLALLTDLLNQNPRAALSLEFLERNQQLDVDDYLDGIIDIEALLDRLGVRTPERREEWKRSYIRLIDAAKAARAPVTAANAPRRYVRLARTAGYDRLKKLPADRLAQIDFPKSTADSAYREQFFALMEDSGARDSPQHANDVAASFRSQRLWDATMAQSMVNTLKRGATQVLHVVGRFHVDEQGGTVLELRARMGGIFSEPGILTISCVQSDARALAEEDVGRADIVIHTGARPEEPATQPSAQPDAQPESQPATQAESQPERADGG